MYVKKVGVYSQFARVPSVILLLKASEKSAEVSGCVLKGAGTSALPQGAPGPEAQGLAAPS